MSLLSGRSERWLAPKKLAMKVNRPGIRRSGLRPVLETREHRAVLSVCTDLATYLGPLTHAQSTLDTVLNAASRTPLPNQNGAGSGNKRRGAPFR
jgi:hypothetical protein